MASALVVYELVKGLVPFNTCCAPCMYREIRGGITSAAAHNTQTYQRTANFASIPAVSGALNK